MPDIVVIDDEYIVVQGIKAILDRKRQDQDSPFAGCHVTGFAYNGIDALKVLEEKRPDLVITDIRIPGLDGLSLIEESREFLPDTDFIVISGYTEFEYARRALSLGVVSYIDKPVTIQKIGEALLKVKTEREMRKKRYDRFYSKDTVRQLETSTDDMIHAVMTGDEEGMERASIAMLSSLDVLSDSLDAYRQEAYKAVCVVVEVYNELRELRDKKKVPSYLEFKTMEDTKRLKERMASILDEVKSAVTAGKVEPVGHQTVRQVLEYIGTHYDQDIGLEELADRVHLNPAYLSLLFKENVGTSYIKYLTDLRVEKAKKLLLEGLKVTEVSEKVGYHNYRYFCDIFKKKTGQTPNEYRGQGSR